MIAILIIPKQHIGQMWILSSFFTLSKPAPDGQLRYLICQGGSNVNNNIQDDHAFSASNLETVRTEKANQKQQQV